MPYSITRSTKIITLPIAPVLFILVDVLSRFAMDSGVQILLSLERCTFFSEGTNVHIHQKDLNLCLPLYHYVEFILMNCKKHKEGIQLSYAYGSYNQTK